MLRPARRQSEVIVDSACALDQQLSLPVAQAVVGRRSRRAHVVLALCSCRTASKHIHAGHSADETLPCCADIAACKVFAGCCWSRAHYRKYRNKSLIRYHVCTTIPGEAKNNPLKSFAVFLATGWNIIHRLLEKQQIILEDYFLPHLIYYHYYQTNSIEIIVRACQESFESVLFA